jgi:hypothetical membrane protein
MNPAVVRSLGLTGLVGCVSILLTDVAGILLRPGYNPFSGSVSDLALGPTGWVQATGMALAGIGIVACVVGFYLVLSRAWEVVLGEAFLFLSGSGLAVAAFFKTGSPGIGGEVHGGSSIAAAALFLPVCFLVSPAVRESKPLFIYTVVAGILQIGLEVGRGVLPSHWMFFGLHERLIGANALAWVATMAWTMLIGYARRQNSGAFHHPA